MRSRLLLGLAAAVVFGIAVPTASATYGHLQPGVPEANLKEKVHVNVVFVGFSRSQVGEHAFRDGLPKEYEPVVRSRLLYGNTEKLGIDYRYDYSVTYTNAAWESAFFKALKGLAQPAPRTAYQDAYNDQDGTRDVGDNNFIDAPSVEKWLIDHAPYGVNTRKDTIFFVNWWGRSDFIDHVYTKFGEPDPDTGNDFGKVRESRKIIAWGGTTPDDEETGLGKKRGVNRVWFFDLSAGPEAWGSNYDITNEDLDGDGEPDYRIPVAWEYAANGYRSPSLLASDLALLARYGAINLLFTSSPLYPPYLTPQLLPKAINLDLNTYEAWPGVDASGAVPEAGLPRERGERALPDADVRRHGGPEAQGQGGDLLRALGAGRHLLRQPAAVPGVREPVPLRGAEHRQVRSTRARSSGARAGSTRRRSSTTRRPTTSRLPGCSGYADDNYVDGTQSFVFGFISPGVVDAGYGLTTTEIHELGHHFGMSHPHDGYDSETGVDYEPTGPYYFAWAADENNSMMSYIDLNWDFSQFDRDNAARHQAAGYILNANVIAGRILASKNAGKAAGYLAAADAAVAKAEKAMADHDYTATWYAARGAYELVLARRRPRRRPRRGEPRRLVRPSEGEEQEPPLRGLRPHRRGHAPLSALDVTTRHGGSRALRAESWCYTEPYGSVSADRPGLHRTRGPDAPRSARAPRPGERDDQRARRAVRHLAHRDQEARAGARGGRARHHREGGPGAARAASGRGVSTTCTSGSSCTGRCWTSASTGSGS